MTLCSYTQSNGYKPAPLDLNHVKLTPNQNTLVERLAENGHNVWARDRVRQGWTYSIVQVRFANVAPSLFPLPEPVCPFISFYRTWLRAAVLEFCFMAF